MANQFLALSLFVMLLSFFIVLNSMSNFELSKSRSILNSISMTFSSTDDKADFQPNLQPSLDNSFLEGDSLEQLGSLFESQIAGVDIQKNRLGTEMRVRVELERFEKSILSSGTLDDEFMPMLVSVFQSQDTVPYRMDMVINMQNNPANIQNEKPEAVREQAQKAAALANALERAGMPQKLLSAGVGQGPDGMIDLYFRRYSAFDPTGQNAGG